MKVVTSQQAAVHQAHITPPRKGKHGVNDVVSHCPFFHRAGPLVVTTPSSTFAFGSLRSRPFRAKQTNAKDDGDIGSPEESTRNTNERLKKIMEQMSSIDWSRWKEKVLEHERVKNLRAVLGETVSHAEFMRLEIIKKEIIDSYPLWKNRLLKDDLLRLKIIREHVSTHPNVYMRMDEILRKNDPNLLLPAVPKKPKYPIVLAHGAGGDAGFGLLKYFAGVKEDLEGLGIRVAQFRVESYGTIAKRATTLAHQVREFQKESGSSKLNIIGHSMGGLDARYFVTHLQGHDITSSLLTISTPHRGSSYADWGLKRYGEPLRLESLVNYFEFEFHAYPQLKMTYLNDTFNPQTPDHPDVSYFSVAGAVRMPKYHVLAWSGDVVEKLEGPNDGLVSVDSAIWGRFLGTVPLNHAEQIGWSSTIDPRALFRKLVNSLVEEGH